VRYPLNNATKIEKLRAYDLSDVVMFATAQYVTVCHETLDSAG